jgi:hypothetical protein
MKLELSAPTQETELERLPAGGWMVQKEILDFMFYDRYWPSASKDVSKMKTLSFEGKKWVNATDLIETIGVSMAKEVQCAVTTSIFI